MTADWAILIFIISFIMGWFITLIIENIRYWLDQRRESKQITMLPDGKGGYVYFRGTYIPINPEKEKPND